MNTTSYHSITIHNYSFLCFWKEFFSLNWLYFCLEGILGLKGHPIGHVWVLEFFPNFICFQVKEIPFSSLKLDFHSYFRGLIFLLRNNSYLEDKNKTKLWWCHLCIFFEESNQKFKIYSVFKWVENYRVHFLSKPAKIICRITIEVVQKLKSASRI